MSLGRDSFGWTTFTQDNGLDKIFYCSFSIGNDSWNGLHPDNTLGGLNGPVKSLSKAQTLMTNGHADWFLLRMGDTWDGTAGAAMIGGLFFSGRSASEPAVIGAYDPANPGIVNPAKIGGVRPLVIPADGANVMSSAGSKPLAGNNIAVVGIEFYAITRDPTNGAFLNTNNGSLAIDFFNGFTNFAFMAEDCFFHYFAGNLNLEPGTATTTTDVLLRRCVFTDAYKALNNSSGVFLSNTVGSASPGIRVEECVFDHNGFNWLIPGASMSTQNHNLYIHGECAPASVVGCIFANGSETGIQQRSGGIAANNLFVRNPQALFCASNTSLVSNNVFTESNDLSRNPIITNAGTVANGSNSTLNFAISGTQGNFIPATPSVDVPAVGDHVRNGNPTNAASVLSTATVTAVNLSTGAVTLSSPIQAPGVSSGDQMFFTPNQDLQGNGLLFGFPSTPVSPMTAFNNIFCHSANSFGTGVAFGLTAGNATLTNGTPASIATAGTFVIQNNAPLIFGSAAGGGLTPFTQYYAVNSVWNPAGLTGSTFNVAATPGGSPIATIGAAGAQILYVPNVTYNNNIVYKWDTNCDLTTSSVNTLTPNTVNLVGTNGNAAADGSGITYKDATRTVGAYGALWGTDGTLTGFLTEARKQSKNNWRPQFTAPAVNNWIRDGFNVVNYGRLR